MKSVSTLWAVAEPAVAAVIEQAHQAAVKDALAFIEKHALFTRTGPQGIRQVNVRGLVATAFTHRDSRAGDPDLHTHVAVANKVQTLDGRWLSIDGRVLFKANVAASETYNTALEQHLRDTLGGAVRRTARHRPGEAADPGDRRCRPPTEPALVDPPRPHRSPPRRAGRSSSSMIMAGRRPRSKRCIWRSRRPWRPATPSTNPAPWPSNAPPGSTKPQRCSADVDAVASMVQTALAPPAETATIADARWVAQTADHILAVMEASRSTWQMWHVRAEAQRQVRTVDVPAEQADGTGGPAGR